MLKKVSTREKSPGSQRRSRGRNQGSGLFPSFERSRNRLRRTVLFLLCLLLLPFLLLLFKVYEQLESQSFFQLRTQAEELARQIDKELSTLVLEEEQRPFSDYQFLGVGETPLLKQKEVQFSPLAQSPDRSKIPGLVGYFQIDPDGRLLTPLLPDAPEAELRNMVAQYGIASGDIAARLRTQKELYAILSANTVMKEERKTAVTSPMNGAASEVAKSVAGTQPAPSAPRENRAEEDSFGAADEQRALSDDREREYSSAGATASAGAAAARAPLRRKAEEEIAQKEASYERKTQSLSLNTIFWDRAADKSAVKSKDDAEKAPAKKGYLSAARDLAESGTTKLRSQRKEQIYLPLNAGQGDYLTRGSAAEAPAQAPAPADSQLPAQEAEGKSFLETDLLSERQFLAQGTASQSRTGSLVQERIPLLSFEGAIDPMQFTVLDDGHFVFFRKIARENERYVQGFLVRGDDFLKYAVENPFLSNNLSLVASLDITHRGTPLAELGSAAAEGGSRSRTLLDMPLSAPLGSVELLFRAGRIDGGPERRLADFLALTFIVCLSSGLVVIYRLGLREIELAKQHSNFVSAVSHELKTPLTSIRMYGEMLREGWVTDDEKRRSYYDFIFFESERLSRLIANVLQLARLSNQSVEPELKEFTAAELLDLARSKVESHVQAAGFRLEVSSSLSGEGCKVLADGDSFCQVVINLVDNAIKFSAQAEERTILLGAEIVLSEGRREAVFSIRDYGPGIERAQIKKIFQLFFRGETELTRATPGTGIGLALVKALTSAMHATVDVSNKNPGAEFRIAFQCR